MTRDRTPRRRRAAWHTEIRPALSPDVRHRLAVANPGCVVDADALDALDRELRILVREPERLDVPITERRAELAELIERTHALRAALGGLPARDRDALTAALVLDRGWQAHDLSRLAEALATLGSAAARTLADIPATGGRPSTARRDVVIRAVAAWVETLPPTRAAAKVRDAIRRENLRDPLRLPLRAPADDVSARLVKSVRAVLEALQLRAGEDLPVIIRKTLGKKPT